MNDVVTMLGDKRCAIRWASIECITECPTGSALWMKGRADAIVVPYKPDQIFQALVEAMKVKR